VLPSDHHIVRDPAGLEAIACESAHLNRMVCEVRVVLSAMHIKYQRIGATRCNSEAGCHPPNADDPGWVGCRQFHFAGKMVKTHDAGTKACRIEKSVALVKVRCPNREIPRVDLCLDAELFLCGGIGNGQMGRWRWRLGGISGAFVAPGELGPLRDRSPSALLRSCGPARAARSKLATR
jgi:hypothetical protein